VLQIDALVGLLQFDIHGREALGLHARHVLARQLHLADAQRVSDVDLLAHLREHLVETHLGAQLARGLAELAHALAHGLQQLGHALRAHCQQQHQEDDREFADADAEHWGSPRGRARASPVNESGSAAAHT